MPQASAISRPKFGLPSAELNLGGTSTSEKVFLGSDGNPLVLPLPVADLAGPAGKRLSAFKIFAAGRVTGGTTTNLTVQLQYGTSATVASNLDLESAAAVAVNSVSGIWTLDGTYVIDNVSGKIDGYSNCLISGSTVTFTATAKADNTVTSSSTATLSFTTTDVQGFVLTGTFSGGSANNVAYVDVFQLEMIG